MPPEIMRPDRMSVDEGEDADQHCEDPEMLYRDPPETRLVHMRVNPPSLLAGALSHACANNTTRPMAPVAMEKAHGFPIGHSTDPLDEQPKQLDTIGQRLCIAVYP
jgi:hypothetical protein